MMDVFKPLADSAAWWVEVDAYLRLLWSAVGVISIVALAVASFVLGSRVIRNLKAEVERQAKAKNKP